MHGARDAEQADGEQRHCNCQEPELADDGESGNHASEQHRSAQLKRLQHLVVSAIAIEQGDDEAAGTDGNEGMRRQLLLTPPETYNATENRIGDGFEPLDSVAELIYLLLLEFDRGRFSMQLIGIVPQIFRRRDDAHQYSEQRSAYKPQAKPLHCSSPCALASAAEKRAYRNWPWGSGLFVYAAEQT